MPSWLLLWSGRHNLAVGAYDGNGHRDLDSRGQNRNDPEDLPRTLAPPKQYLRESVNDLHRSLAHRRNNIQRPLCGLMRTIEGALGRIVVATPGNNETAPLS
jgi:hypothetical protein